MEIDRAHQAGKHRLHGPHSCRFDGRVVENVLYLVAPAQCFVLACRQAGAYRIDDPELVRDLAAQLGDCGFGFLERLTLYDVAEDRLIDEMGRW